MGPVILSTFVNNSYSRNKKNWNAGDSFEEHDYTKVHLDCTVVTNAREDTCRKINICFVTCAVVTLLKSVLKKINKKLFIHSFIF